MTVHIGSTLNKLLRRKKISQKEFAEMLGISPRSVRRMLRKKYLHAASLVKIGEALNHDVIRYLYLPGNLPGNAELKKRTEELEKENAALKKENNMLSELNTLLKKK